MKIELSENDIQVLRKGLFELPVKIALETLAHFDEEVLKSKNEITPEEIPAGVEMARGK